MIQKLTHPLKVDSFDGNVHVVFRTNWRKC